MVLANNEMRLREVQTRVIQDNDIFNNINAVSLATINRVLHRHQVTVKQLYTVPFERNSDRVKEIWCRYVQRRAEELKERSKRGNEGGWEVRATD
ncbi:hypothetical protein SKAU_G00402640 [Synaphobranchus kaupii]|uniref:Uncharacterized protein n=1 Tax=Synaphobranchus kaupii TaxID=118154 RepID=A0A9Q1E9E8_SYNKA|nr:hypothetical protein SKAU_G00402640 [Synaphobranchus kaupii]